MFTELSELLEHKKTYCKLRFTCKCDTYGSNDKCSKFNFEIVNSINKYLMYVLLPKLKPSNKNLIHLKLSKPITVFGRHSVNEPDSNIVVNIYRFIVILFVFVSNFVFQSSENNY